MNRDYAKRNVYRKKSKKKTSYLGLWLFVLFLFAAFTAGLVYMGKHKQQFHPRPSVPQISPTETITKEVAAPKFDFYTMLPEKKSTKAMAEYELEIATLKDYAAADRLKAELALLGFTASIAPARSKNGTQTYEVSIGPYDNKDGAAADLERLKQNKIRGTIKKIR